LNGKKSGEYDQSTGVSEDNQLGNTTEDHVMEDVTGECLQSDDISGSVLINEAVKTNEKASTENEPTLCNLTSSGDIVVYSSIVTTSVEPELKSSDNVEVNKASESSVSKTESVLDQPHSTHSQTLSILHRDITCRADRKRRSQTGKLHIQLYTACDAPCVRCQTCHQMMSVASFMRHTHWRGATDRLAVVAAPQRLLLYAPQRATASEMDMWRNFLVLQEKFSKETKTFHTNERQTSEVKSSPLSEKTTGYKAFGVDDTEAKSCAD